MNNFDKKFNLCFEFDFVCVCVCYRDVNYGIGTFEKRYSYTSSYIN